MPASQPPNKTQIRALKQDVLTVEGGGILVPSLSTGQMLDGLAARIKSLLGDDVEQQVMNHAPIAVGAAFVTTVPEKMRNKVPCHHLVHVPLVEEPGVKAGIENVRRAARAGLLGAAKFEMEQVAIPGIGYEENGVPPDEIARAIVDEIKGFRSAVPGTVLLMDDNEEMYAAFVAEIGGKAQR